MLTIKIGDLVILKSHPYSTGITSLKISANTLLVPPIMVVDQLVYTSVQKDIPEKVRGRYYNSMRNKFEEYWFPIEMLLPIIDPEISHDVSYELYGKYTIKTCQLELTKLKANFQEENGVKKTSSASILNHLPPILILVGHSNIVIKGNLKIKDFDNEGWRMKWFNPDSGKFHEEILPSSILMKLDESPDLSLIDSYIKSSSLFKYSLESKIVFGKVNFQYSYFKIIDMRYNHYLTIVKCFDIILNETFELPIDKLLQIAVQDNEYDFEQIFVENYPKLCDEKFIYPYDIKFELGLLYRIKYINNFGEKSIRAIIPLRMIDSHNLSEYDLKDKENGILIEAYCLLRREIRYFWTKRIKHISISRYKVF